MSRTWVNGSPPFLNADNLNALEADVTTALGVPDAALAARVVTGATATALNATYAPASVSSSKADKSTTVSAGTGLTGGGDLSASRTLAVAYGTAAGTAAQGNDSRITGAAQAANNLSDLPSAPSARTNLGLGDSATHAASDFAPTNGGNTTNLRAVALDTPTFDGSFTFSKISGTQDGLFAVKNLNVSAGFGGQVGQGGSISYFKGLGIQGHHSGAGNYDHVWGSLIHSGTREAGMFICDITGTRGGNVYGGHFQVIANTTAPPFMVGASFELIPSVARSATSANTLGTTIAAATPTTSVTLGTAVQLTDGTNLSFTASDSTTVVAYVNGSMGSSSTTVPVVSFTSAAAINSGSTVTVGVNSSYFGAVARNSGNQTAGAAFHVEAPAYTGTKSTTPPFLIGFNLDSSAASSAATGIFVGGSWGSGINMNANSIVSAGSISATGSSPNRDVRLVDNMLLDNARYIKLKNAAGTARNILQLASTDNLRLIMPGASNEIEFYDSTEATQLARITSGGRADFSLAGITTKYTNGATQPAYLTNGQVEVWHDTGSGNDYLVVNVNGVSKKVALT